MRKVIYILSGVFLALLVALFLVPRFVDLNQYKEQISSETEKVLGRKLIIKGDISLSLFPSPSIRVDQIELENDQRSSKPHMLKAKGLSVTVSWLPLLMKEISVQHIYLDQPEIVLEKYKDGANWDFLLALRDQPQADKDLKDASQETPKTSPGFDVSVQRIDIRKGLIEYHADKSVTRLEKVNVNIQADDIRGPYEVSGGVTVEGKPVSLELNTGVFSVDEPVDIATNVTYGKHQLSVKGSFDQKTPRFKGKVEGKIKASDVSEELATRVGETLGFSAEAVADDKRVEISKVKIEAKENEATGRASLNWTGKQDYTLELKHLPGKTNITVKGSLAHMDPLSGRVDLTSDYFGLFLKWIEVDVSELPKSALSKFALKASFSAKPAEMSLSRLVLAVGNARMTGDVTWKDPVLQLNVQTPKVGPWLALAKIQAARELGRVHLKGTLEGDMNKMKLNTTVQALQGTFKATGLLQNLAKAPEYRLSLDIDHSNINRMLQGLGVTDFPLALGALKVKTEVQGRPTQIQLSNLQGSIAPQGKTTSLSGSATYRFASKRPQLEFALELGRLNLDSLFALSASERKVTHSGQSNIILTSAKPASGRSSFKGWSREPFDFSGMNALDAKGKVKISSLVYDPYVLNSVSMDINLAKGNLNIPNFNSNLFGGAMTGKMTLQAAKVAPSLSMSAKLQNANLKRVIGKGSKWDMVGGTANLDLNLTTAGQSQFDWVSHLNGAIIFDINGTTLIGTDYGALAQNLLKLTNPTALFGVLERAQRGGKTTKANLKGRFNIVNGVAQAQDVNLSSPPANGLIEGQINLPKYQMDMRADMRLRALKGLPVRVRFHGPLDAPKKSFNVDQITGQLFKQVGGQIINRLIGGAVGGPGGAIIGVPGLPIPIPGLGGESGSEQDSQPSEPESGEQKTQPTSPKKVLKGVLRGLFK